MLDKVDVIGRELKDFIFLTSKINEYLMLESVFFIKSVVL